MEDLKLSMAKAKVEKFRREGVYSRHGNCLKLRLSSRSRMEETLSDSARRTGIRDGRVC